MLTTVNVELRESVHAGCITKHHKEEKFNLCHSKGWVVTKKAGSLCDKGPLSYRPHPVSFRDGRDEDLLSVCGCVVHVCADPGKPQVWLLRSRLSCFLDKSLSDLGLTQRAGLSVTQQTGALDV